MSNTFTQTTFVTHNLVIEPLNGVLTVDDLMDRFPEETYQQGRDTRLYRFLTALCGDSGAGLAKKQAYAARLRYEAEFVSFNILDELFAAQFKIQRLPSEGYNYKTNVESLTPSQWDHVWLADQSYYQRVAKWWNATRYGSSPEGVRLAAEAGIGEACDIVEHYKYVYDQYSDLPLKLQPYGHTASTQEFVIIPRLKDFRSIYHTKYEKRWKFIPPSLNFSQRPVTVNSITTVQSHLVPPDLAYVQLVASKLDNIGIITMPGHQTNDLIVIVAMATNGPAAVPSGWTVHSTAQKGNLYATIAYRTATNGATSLGSWGSKTRMLAILIYRPINGQAVIRNVNIVVEDKTPVVRLPAVSTPPISTQSVTDVIIAPDMPRCVYPNPDEVSLDQIREGVKKGIYCKAQWAPVRKRVGGPIAAKAMSPGMIIGHQDHVSTTLQSEIVPLPGMNEVTGMIVFTIEVGVQPNPGFYVETVSERMLRLSSEVDDTTLTIVPTARLKPELERNAHNMLDRLKPVNTLAYFNPDEVTYTTVIPRSAPVASSERIHVSRLVTGQGGVFWPDVNSEEGFFIVPNQETEATSYYGAARELPVIFITIEAAHAYTEAAQFDETYGTDDFYLRDENGIAPISAYTSEHTGQFLPIAHALWPFTKSVTNDLTFGAARALAPRNTLLIMEGSVNA